MYMPFLAAAMLLLTAGAEPEEQQRALMDAIEKQVQLPKGAYHLDDYIRYYDYDESGKIVGVYVLSNEWAEGGCEEINPDGSRSIVPHCYRWRNGRRQWGHAIISSGGGCSVVNIVFNPSTLMVEKTFCNSME